MTEKDKPFDEGHSAQSAGSMDQIRELLFGQLQRDLDLRFQKLEKKIDRSVEEGADQLSSVQNTLNKKLDTTASDLGERIKALSIRLDGVESSAKKDTATLDKQFTNDLNALSETLKKNINSLREELESAVETLQGEKTGNKDLGASLVELGMRLQGDKALEKIQASLSSAKADKGNAKPRR